MSELAGQVALVTGSSRGLGRGIALVLAEQGADLIVNYKSAEAKAEEVVSQIRQMGRRAIKVRADVSISDEVNGLFELAIVQERRTAKSS